MPVNDSIVFKGVLYTIKAFSHVKSTRAVEFHDLRALVKILSKKKICFFVFPRATTGSRTLSAIRYLLFVFLCKLFFSFITQ